MKLKKQSKARKNKEYRRRCCLSYALRTPDFRAITGQTSTADAPNPSARRVWARRPIDAAPFLLCRAQRSTGSERTRASRRDVVRILRRCVCFVGPHTDQEDTRFVGEVPDSGRHQVAHWQSPHVERMEELDSLVWSPSGVKILGTPVETAEFQQAASHKRLEEEDKLWRAIPSVPLQCAWQLLVQCAVPRCHHFVRTIPRS